MIKIIQGNITTLAVDAIVNAANQVMLGNAPKKLVSEGNFERSENPSNARALKRSRGGVDICPCRKRRVARRSVATEPRGGRKRPQRKWCHSRKVGCDLQTHRLWKSPFGVPRSGTSGCVRG